MRFLALCVAIAAVLLAFADSASATPAGALVRRDACGNGVKVCGSGSVSCSGNTCTACQSGGKCCTVARPASSNCNSATPCVDFSTCTTGSNSGGSGSGTSTGGGGGGGGSASRPPTCTRAQRFYKALGFNINCV